MPCVSSCGSGRAGVGGGTSTPFARIHDANSAIICMALDFVLASAPGRTPPLALGRAKPHLRTIVSSWAAVMPFGVALASVPTNLMSVLSARASLTGYRRSRDRTCPRRYLCDMRRTPTCRQAAACQSRDSDRYASTLSRHGRNCLLSPASHGFTTSPTYRPVSGCRRPKSSRQAPRSGGPFDHAGLWPTLLPGVAFRLMSHDNGAYGRRTSQRPLLCLQGAVGVDGTHAADHAPKLRQEVESRLQTPYRCWCAPSLHRAQSL